MESDATVRGDFEVQTLWFGGLRAEATRMRSAPVERVLARQTPALRELYFFNVESVKFSSLSAFTSQSPVVIRVGKADETLADLRKLRLESCEVKMDDISANKPRWTASLPVNSLSDSKNWPSSMRQSHLPA